MNTKLNINMKDINSGTTAENTQSSEEKKYGYNDKILNFYHSDENVGSLDKNDENVGTGIVGAPACGDVLKLQIKVDPKTDTIVDAKFKTFGCGSAIAASALAVEYLKKSSVDNAAKITNDDLSKELSLPPIKRHCSMLAEEAIHAALQDLKNKKQKNLSQ